jgi:H+/gluconate symporter-like permease
MELWLWLAAAGVVIGAIIVYVAFMVFLPEWVGITGKTAIENEKSHKDGETAKDNSFLQKLHGDKKKS